MKLAQNQQVVGDGRERALRVRFKPWRTTIEAARTNGSSSAPSGPNFTGASNATSFVSYRVPCSNIGVVSSAAGCRGVRCANLNRRASAGLAEAARPGSERGAHGRSAAQDRCRVEADARLRSVLSTASGGDGTTVQQSSQRRETEGSVRLCGLFAAALLVSDEI